jgi:hypothetical protein
MTRNSARSRTSSTISVLTRPIARKPANANSVAPLTAAHTPANATAAVETLDAVSWIKTVIIERLH